MSPWVIAAVSAGIVVFAWWASRALRERPHVPERVDLADFGLERVPGNAALVFTAPYSLACGAWIEALETVGTPYVQVDVQRTPDLADRYRVSRTPLVLAVRRDTGEVAAAYGDQPSPADVSHISALVAA
ncbi:MAG: hypothetical protein QOE65_1180 [Solirubrobacteraceae bacterium]|jgi:hypothetical protein|nr:hypothetical protein [Solirubrobacteraceae bacterium]